MEDSLELKLEIVAHHEIAVMRCMGRLTFGKETQLLKKCVDSVLSQFSVCVLALDGIAQIDARGLGTIIGCFERARALGSLLLVGGASEHVHDLLRITQLDRILEVYSSEAEALEACAQAA
ncbi:MAG: STAS domain-containing protein [Acidobacteria bacterium]|nr:STAS domain-containing protein [Acidobacteriota bacterium]MBV9145984.1 STAS domain-containing protein [Acidobacteriota bacterium]